jgi:endonuclease G
MKYIIGIALATLLTSSLSASCDQFYFKKPSVTISNYVICNSEYTTVYNPATKTPVYSADVLTKDSVALSTHLVRKNSFHPESSIPTNIASTLNDYDKTGYDRGHMVPCDDMTNTADQYQSFSLVNMVPQNPNNNRGLWKKLEEEARNDTKTEPKVYVISGPIYDNYNTKIGNNVIVPTRLFKIIFLPTQNKTIVYVVHNSDNSDLNTTTLSELQKVTPLRF